MRVTRSRSAGPPSIATSGRLRFSARARKSAQLLVHSVSGRTLLAGCAGSPQTRGAGPDCEGRVYGGRLGTTTVADIAGALLQVLRAS
jgi:hypothetical protein